MKRALLCLAAVLLVPAQALAAPPLLPIQGRLTDALDAPIDGPLDVAFTLYEDEAGAVPVWSVTRTVAFTDGRFAVYLGEIEPLELELFETFDDLRLGVEVGVDGEMPLFRLGTVAYAAFAAHCGDFADSAAADIVVDDAARWDEAHGWGDHAAAGYLTGLSETDPAFNASPAAAIDAAALTRWDTAHSWGDHAAAGYLTAESDPAFSASPAASIDAAALTRWEGAFGWGDHATAGYLTAENDPAFGASAAAGIDAAALTRWDTAHSWGDHAAAGYLTAESDPAFGASAAAGIDAAALTRWDTAHSWGDHAAAGYLTSFSETDPAFGASAAAGIDAADMTRWDTAHSWGDHAAAGYLTSGTETDPAFVASPAGTIGSADLAAWNDAAANRIHGADHAVSVRMISAGLSAPNPSEAGVTLNGSAVLATRRSYGLVALERATGVVVESATYDVFGDITQADQLAAQLDAYDDTYIVLVTTYDEPQANRAGTGNALRSALLRCGATAVTLDAIQRRGAYLLAGICDGSEGSGYEFYAGQTNDSAAARVEANFEILDGEIVGAPPRVVTLAPTSTFNFISDNTWRPVDLVHTVTLREPTTLRLRYGMSLTLSAVSPSDYIVSRISMNTPDGLVVPVETRSIGSDSRYVSVDGELHRTLGPGTYTFTVQYRTTSGTLHRPATADWEQRHMVVEMTPL